MAPADTSEVSTRLPNSITPWTSSSLWIEVSVHLGQVGQPRPEPVSRTAEPVNTISTSSTRAAKARRRWV